MKKLLSKQTGKEQNAFVGKVFTIGRFNVVVEDVIAEGKILFKKKYSMLVAFIINYEGII